MNDINRAMEWIRQKRLILLLILIASITFATLSLANVWPWLQIVARIGLFAVAASLVFLVYRATMHAPRSENVVEDSDSSEDTRTILLPIIDPDSLPPAPSNPPTIHNLPKKSKMKMVKRAIVWMACSTVVIIFCLLTDKQFWEYVLWLAVMTLVIVLMEWLATTLHHLWTDLRQTASRSDDTDKPTVVPEKDDSYYHEDPHLTMFVNRIALQALLWILTLFIGIWIVRNEHTSLGWNILAQYIISQINLYFIIRAYIIWHDTDHIITKSNYIRIQHEDLFFWVRRKSLVTVIKQTLVNAEREKRTLTEFLFFKQRGTIQLTEQVQDAKKSTRVRYVKYPDKFIEAINAR